MKGAFLTTARGSGSRKHGCQRHWGDWFFIFLGCLFLWEGDVFVLLDSIQRSDRSHGKDEKPKSCWVEMLPGSLCSIFCQKDRHVDKHSDSHFHLRHLANYFWLVKINQWTWKSKIPCTWHTIPKFQTFTTTFQYRGLQGSKPKCLDNRCNYHSCVPRNVTA